MQRNRFARGALSLVVTAGFFASSGCMEIDDEDMIEDSVEVGRTEQALVDVMTSPGQNGFSPKYLAHNYFCLGNETCDIADFNGDGRDDVITLVPNNGEVWVATSDGRTFTGNRIWIRNFAGPQFYYDFGDFNGDGRDDIARFNRTTGDVHVAYSWGGRFSSPRLVLRNFCWDRQECRVGNVNDDGYADIVKFVGTRYGGTRRYDAEVALGRGYYFSTPAKWHDDICRQPSQCHLADITGDGLDDVIQLATAAGGGSVVATKSTGSSFGTPQFIRQGFCDRGETCDVGDVDGTGRADLVTFQRRHVSVSFPGPEQADVLVRLAQMEFSALGTNFGEARIRSAAFCAGNRICKLADVNGDGRDDLVEFARSDARAFGDVYVALSDFGKTTTWRMDLDTLRARAVEGDADQPYLIAISFRTTLGRSGSTRLSHNSFRNTSWAHRIRRGQTRAIPSWEGEHTFTNVRLPTIGELSARRPPPLEVLGTLVVAMEHDWTPWGEIDGLVRRIDAALLTALGQTIESTSLISLVTNPAAFEQRMTDATEELRNALNVDVPEAIRLGIVSGFDPDDLIDYHVYLYPAIDKEGSSVLPPSSNRRVSVGIPGDGWGGYWPTYVNYDDSGDSPIRWTVRSQMEFVP